VHNDLVWNRNRQIPVESRASGQKGICAMQDKSYTSSNPQEGGWKRQAGCETPPSGNGSRRAVSPDTCLLALGRCEGFDVARLCHFVRKLCPALAE
jgi:hypothetical protein